MAGLSQRTTTQNAKLKGLESLTTLMVMAGGMATLMTQNMGLAAAPLGLAVVINLYNRRQMDRLTHHYAELRLQTLQRSLQHDLQTIQKGVSEHQRAIHESELPHIRHHITVLSARVKHLSIDHEGITTATPLSALADQIETLKQQAQDCGRSLTLIMQGLHNASSKPVAGSPLAALKAKIHHHQTASAASVTHPTTATTQLHQTWSQEMQALHAQIKAIQLNMQPTAPTLTVAQGPDLTRVQGQIANLNQQLAGVQSHFSQQLYPFAQEQQALQSALHHLQEQLARLQSGLPEMLSSQGNSIPSQTEVEEWIDTAVIPLQVRFVSLVNCLEQFEVDLHGLAYQSQQLQQLHRQMLSIHQQVQQVQQIQIMTTKDQDG